MYLLCIMDHVTDRNTSYLMNIISFYIFVKKMSKRLNSMKVSRTKRMRVLSTLQNVPIIKLNELEMKKK